MTIKSGNPIQMSECLENIKQLITFSELGKAITSSLEVKEILSTVMEKINAHFHPKDWSLLLLDAKKCELTYEIVVGKDSDKIRERHPKVGEGIAGWVAKEGLPLLVTDIEKDQRFSNLKESLYDFVTGPVICIPLKSRGKVLGVIELYNVEENHLTNETDMLFLATLADYTAIAIENSLLFQQVQDLTVTDDLTTLFNSRYFHRALDYEVEKADRYQYNLSMIFIDMDHFKNVNDSHGHLCGSDLLREVGAIVQESIRNIDIGCRYGGDEFVILMPETGKDEALVVAERLRNAINENIFLKKTNVNYHITASFGVATFPEDAKTKLELIDLTDKAMYKVKNSTRDAIAVHGR